MKKIYYLLLTLAISSLSFGQEGFNLAGGGAFPTGWTATNNVTTNDIDKGSYFLLDSGDPSDIIVSAVYDLSAYSSAEFSLDVATFGSGDNNSATIEFSYDGGTTYTQSETSAVATSSSYIDGGSFAVTPSAQVVIKLTNTGVTGRGNRLRNLVLIGVSSPTAPTTNAPTPEARDAADVISIYSDAYSSITVGNYNPGWGQSGSVDAAYDPTGEGTNTVLAYTNFNYQGTEFGNQDASAMEYFHVDVWTATAGAVLKVTPINNGTGTVEVLVDVALVNAGWSSVDIPKASFTGMTWDSVFQLKFDGQLGTNPSDVYIDNIYFWKEPTAAGTDVTLSDLTLDGTTIAGFSAGATSYTVDLVEGTTTVPSIAAVPTDSNATVAVTDATSVPGSGSVVVTAADGTTTATITITFTATIPAVGAPTPTQAEADVVSVYSDTYSTNILTNNNPGWGQATQVTEVQLGASSNNTLKYSNLNYQGMLYDATDVSSMDYVHLDYYTDDATALEFFVIKEGAGENTYDIAGTLGITTGEWVSVDIPLAHYTGTDLTGVNQFKTVGNGTVYIDNLFFWTEPTTVSGPPCPHTFVMSDQYDDGWNGASVDILVNGVTIVSTNGPANGGSFTLTSEDLAFDAASGDTIALANWVSGIYDSEISWELLDGEGTSLDSGVFGEGAAGVTAYCTPPPPCPHTFVMSDQYDDGWNGASVDILVNGATIVSTNGPASGGSFTLTSEDLAFDAASGDTIALANWVSGIYDSEISWAILDGAGTEIAAGVFGEGTDAVTGNCPSCFAPTDLSASGITTTGAVVSWVSDGTAFLIELQPAGSLPGTPGGYVIGDMVPYTATSVDLTGNLDPGTSYDIYVTNVCDGVNSDPAGPLTFTTECDIVTEFPYTHGFENLDCWSNTNASAAWALDDGSDYGPDSVTEGASAVFFNDYDYSSGSTSDLMSPNLDLSALTVARLSFDYYDGGGSDIVEVLVDSGSGPVVVYTTAATVSSWTTIEIDFPDYAGQTIKVGFRGTSVYGTSNPHIDNLIVAEAPACLDPTNLAVSNITTTTASVSWTANSGESAWEYQVVESGVAPDATGDTTSDNPLELTLLTANTTYDVYVRANCDADGTSEWASVSFTTLPAPIVPDYTNDFTTFPGEFWTTDNGVLNTSLGWGADGFANNGTTGAARLNIYTTTSGLPKADDALISPSFDLSGGTYYLNMIAALTPWTGTTDGAFGEGDYVSVSVTEDAGETWVELFRWDSTNAPTAAGDAMPELDLSSYASSSVQIKIFAQSGTEVVDNDFFIDDFSVTSTSLGLEDVNTSSNFTYFPNPVNNVLSIKAQASIDSITVYNMLGQTVVRSTPNTTTTAVDMSGLQTGAYFVQVAINNSIETVRVIKN